MHVYEMVPVRDTPRRWPMGEGRVKEMHAYERYAYERHAYGMVYGDARL
jgi:hypothetical protein